MSVLFQSISIFRTSLANLCRRERDGYSSCSTDICNHLKHLSFDDIWEMNFRLREIDNIRLIKIRLKNSAQNLSSADGFRLIACCNKKHGSVTLLNIYPKRGKLGRLDQGKEEYKRQLKMYADEFRNGTLVTHDIQNRLESKRP